MPEIQIESAGEQITLRPVPLVLSMECTATQEEMNVNVKATLERGYTPILPYLMREAGAVSICGAGPSLERNLDKLKGDVFAVNSAISYLIKNGISPKWAMIWDCAEICADFAIPHPDTTYLVASRCHASVFEKLKDCRVVVWHACGDHNILEFLESRNVMEPLVNGGTTGITRGIYVAYALGYRDLHLFGAEGSYDGERSHVNGSLVYEQKMPVIVKDRLFMSTPQWAAQTEELRIMYPKFRKDGGASITAHDEGLTGWVISIMKNDEDKAYADAERLIELQKEANGKPVHGVPGVMPSGSVSEMAQQGIPIAIEAMKTLERAP